MSAPGGDDGGRPHVPDRAFAVETYVERRRGQWAVDIVVIFEDEVIRRTINTFRSERRAQAAASWIKRAAQRDIRGPIDG
jgi:hypothetical protein